MNTEIKNFQKAYNELIDQFVKIYYPCQEWTIDPEMWYLGIENKPYHYPILIGDDYWDIEDIYIALYENIPSDTLHEWCSYALEEHMKWEIPMNLYNYYKNQKEK